MRNVNIFHYRRRTFCVSLLLDHPRLPPGVRGGGAGGAGLGAAAGGARARADPLVVVVIKKVHCPRSSLLPTDTEISPAAA